MKWLDNPLGRVFLWVKYGFFARTNYQNFGEFQFVSD
ncbi:Uncharacterised protein [Serratia marcescens]|nr:hypothetical protein SM10VA1_30960 [Serratia marcescens]CAE7780992.1 hypothetical protein AI2795V1_3605 [Serratia marcescens]CAH3834734.1 hypothetical protein AI2795V1_3605 [Serratia marcescens]CUZ77531.1 Uncharacterised protein [Serratia marcescens]CVB48939.1 Uncharacterised protein [Serratia marcescens]